MNTLPQKSADCDEKQKSQENVKNSEMKNSISQSSNSKSTEIERPISPHLALSLKIGEV